MDLKPQIGVGVAIVQNEQILLIKRLKEPEAGCWALPGGKIDLYETCENAIIRETQEELGIIIKNPFLLTIMDMWNEDLKYHWVAPIYLVVDFEGIPSIQEPNKHESFAWFSINNLPNDCTKSVLAAKEAFITK